MANVGGSRAPALVTGTLSTGDVSGTAFEAVAVDAPLSAAAAARLNSAQNVNTTADFNGCTPPHTDPSGEAGDRAKTKVVCKRRP